MAENTRDFKGVWIPKSVWLDTRLNALEKIILTEIDSLDSTERGCWASNKHIADFCQCSENKVSTAISKLIKLGYLYVQSFDGRTRELKSRLTKNNSLPFEKTKADLQNQKESNIDSNTYSNTDYKESKKAPSAASFNKLLDDYAKGNEEIRALLGDWMKNRKAKRAAMTDAAIKKNLAKLDEYAKASGMTVKAYLDEIVRLGWQAFYPLKSSASKPAHFQQPNASPLQSVRREDYDKEEYPW